MSQQSGGDVALFSFPEKTKILFLSSTPTTATTATSHHQQPPLH